MTHATMLARAECIAAVTRADSASAEAHQKLRAARGVVPAPEPARRPSWWMVTFTLYSGATIKRSVSGNRPNLAAIKRNGWHEHRDDGDEFFINAEAIMTIEIAGGFSDNNLAKPWQQVNAGKRK